VGSDAGSQSSYEELVAALARRDAVIDRQGTQIARQVVLIEDLAGRLAAAEARTGELEAVHEADLARLEALEVLVAGLAGRLGRDSRTSSKPPGSDGPASRAERRAVQNKQRQDERDAAAGGRRKRGGQAGHRGGGLELSADPDVRMPPSEPAACDRCGAGLAGAVLVGRERLQVVDIPAITALVTEYLLVSRRCGCGAVTCAELPEGVRGGPVAYGPNLKGAAALIFAHGHVSHERTAELVAGLFEVAVSTGWIGKLVAQLAEQLHGFEGALKTALLAEPVLVGDETPVNTIEDSVETKAQRGRAFSPHVFTLRCGDLIWLGAGHTRGHAALDSFGLLERYCGVLVSDDFGGYTKYEARLTARQLCNQHLIRSLRGVHEAEPAAQAWAREMIELLRAARRPVQGALVAGRGALTAEEIEKVREHYLACASKGIGRNLRRRTSTGGKHPALVLALRLKTKIDMVLYHLRDFKVPWTSNLAEQALRGVKIHLKVSGCFRTLETTRAYCRIQSYLATTRLHAIPAMDALRAALAGRPWTPLTPNPAP